MKVAIIYWSGTGNTEAMAKALAAGLEEAGAKAALFTAGSSPADLESYDKFAFGCPSMGDEVLEEGEFEPFFAAALPKLSGKKAVLFGSYGWGDGKWMRDWAERAEKSGLKLLDGGLIQMGAPDEALCAEYGRKLASF